MKKILISLFFCLLSVSFFSFEKKEKNIYQQKTRSVEYKKIDFNDASFKNDFLDYSLKENEDGYNFSARQLFDSDIFDEFNFTSLADKDEVVVRYDVNYIESDETILLDIVIEDGDIIMVDTLPGLVSINEAGNPDVLFCCDDEVIWLSDLTENSSIDNAGWLSNLLKKAIDSLAEGLSKLITAFKSIIKPAVKITMFFAYTLLGEENSTKLGAFVLNMYKDEAGIYHAGFDCWQQYFGYTDLYDIAFDAGTSMRSAKFAFDVDGDKKDDYIIWAWKGDYLNLGAGAELGIYKKWQYSNTVWKVDKSQAMYMTLKVDLTVKGTTKTIINWQPTSKQWWITGFNPEFKKIDRDNLKATYTVQFNSNTFYSAFSGKYKSSDNWTYNSKTMTGTFVL